MAARITEQVTDTMRARAGVLVHHGEARNDTPQRAAALAALVAAETLMDGFYVLLAANAVEPSIEDDVMRAVSGAAVHAVWCGAMTQTKVRECFGLDVTGADIDAYREALAAEYGDVPPGVGVPA